MAAEFISVFLIALITKSYIELKPLGSSADLPTMTRGLGLVSLIISLVISGMLFSSQLKGGGGSTPPTPDRNQLVQQAQAAAAAVNAGQADRELAAYQAENGTFAGASVTDIGGVTVVSAGATSYCLRIATTDSVLYDAGPGGSPSSTSC
jgi:hypothetical protein